MIKDIETITSVLHENKGKWLPTTRPGNTGIGKTFEDLLGKVEDNLSLPDIGDIEVKTQRKGSSSLITLFTKSPDEGVKELLVAIGRETFHATLTSRTVYPLTDFLFLWVDKFTSQSLTCSVMIGNPYSDIFAGTPVHTIGWSRENLEQAFKKLGSLAYVRADRKIINDLEHFRYSNMTLYYGLTFDKFISCIRDGYIKIDFRIGRYKTGKRAGTIHDHGTGFRIAHKDLKKLYKHEIEIF